MSSLRRPILFLFDTLATTYTDPRSPIRFKGTPISVVKSASAIGLLPRLTKEGHRVAVATPGTPDYGTWLHRLIGLPQEVTILSLRDASYREFLASHPNPIVVGALEVPGSTSSASRREMFRQSTAGVLLDAANFHGSLRAYVALGGPNPGISPHLLQDNRPFREGVRRLSNLTGLDLQTTETPSRGPSAEPSPVHSHAHDSLAFGPGQ